MTGSLAFPAAQNTPPVNGEPLNVGHIPHLHNFAFSGVFGTTIPSLCHLPRSLEFDSQKLHFLLCFLDDLNISGRLKTGVSISNYENIMISFLFRKVFLSDYSLIT